MFDKGKSNQSWRRKATGPRLFHDVLSCGTQDRRAAESVGLGGNQLSRMS
jgi:hypothetical protein